MQEYNWIDTKENIELILISNKNTNIKKFKFKKVSGIVNKKVGLLNHSNLCIYSGIVYKNEKIFHTFKMNFPITVICLDKNLKIISKPILVNVNKIFIVPFKTHYTIECNSKTESFFLEEEFKKNIYIPSLKTSKFIYFVLKYFKYYLFIFFICLLKFSAFAQEELTLSIGRTRVIDLGKPPLSIQISDPEVLQVERVGITNSIKIIPKQDGDSEITIVYHAGTELKWNVHVGRKSDGNAISQSLNSNLTILDGPQNTKFLNHLVKRINKIDGLKSIFDRDKIIVFGEINKSIQFNEFAKIVTAYSKLIFPAFNILNEIEPEVVSYIESHLHLIGERNLRIIIRNGIYSISGVPSSPAGRLKAWEFVSGLLPNLIDGMSFQVGDSAVVQINLDFLELAKGDSKEFGFTHSLLNGISGNLNIPASILSQGIQSPTLQIGPISSLFKLLQNTTFTRELAKPVVITRSGEKASFLAGGEVPIVTSTSTTASTVSSVTYKPFGILFNVTPKVQMDGSIWIQLNLEVSQVSDDLSFQNIPGFTSRKINTSMILNDGNTALISGLVQNKDVKQVEKFPLLGSIPVIGELFKSRRFQENNTELWVVITASRVNMNKSNFNMSDKIAHEFNLAEKNITGGLLD